MPFSCSRFLADRCRSSDPNSLNAQRCIRPSPVITSCLSVVLQTLSDFLARTRVHVQLWPMTGCARLGPGTHRKLSGSRPGLPLQIFAFFYTWGTENPHCCTEKCLAWMLHCSERNPAGWARSPAPDVVPRQGPLRLTFRRCHWAEPQDNGGPAQLPLSWLLCARTCGCLPCSTADAPALRGVRRAAGAEGAVFSQIRFIF